MLSQYFIICYIGLYWHWAYWSVLWFKTPKISFFPKVQKSATLKVTCWYKFFLYCFDHCMITLFLNPFSIQMSHPKLVLLLKYCYVGFLLEPYCWQFFLVFKFTKSFLITLMKTAQNPGKRYYFHFGIKTIVKYGRIKIAMIWRLIQCNQIVVKSYPFMREQYIDYWKWETYVL